MSSVSLKYRKSAQYLWTFFIIAMLTWVGCSLAKRSVLPDYIFAAQRWLAGEGIYSFSGRGFLYFPQAAIFFIPFAKLPLLSRELLWRFLSVLAYALALRRYVNCCQYNTDKMYFWLSLLVLPFIFSSARNGQMNLLLTAVMLYTLVFIYENKFWHAAFFVSLGFFLKPTMIVLLLLVAASYLGLLWRILLFLCLGFLFPFLCQSFNFVLSQYFDCIKMLQSAFSAGVQQAHWAQLFDCLRLWHVHFSLNTELLIRSFLAFLTYAAFLIVKQRFSKKQQIPLFLALATAYLMLFNPRTENNDYAILAPAFLYFLLVFYEKMLAAYAKIRILRAKKEKKTIGACQLYRRRFFYTMLFLCMVLLAVGIAFAYPLAMFLDGQPYWLAPAATALFFVGLLSSIYLKRLDFRLF